MSIEDEIDRLYQLPLAEFTAGRNALAKRAGGDAAEVRQVAKPTASAWAVNQLYWRERKLYDTVVKSSTRLRAAQASALTGKKVDIDLAEKTKAAAVRDALERARALLFAIGDAASETTMAAVRETLNAIPVAGSTDVRPGRLLEPLTTATGFEALGDLLRGGVIQPATKADVVSFPGKSVRASAAPRERTSESQKAAAARAERASELKELDAKRQSAESSLAQARKSLEGLEEDRRDFEAKLDKNAGALKQTKSDIERLERELKDLARARAKLERE